MEAESFKLSSSTLVCRQANGDDTGAAAELTGASTPVQLEENLTPGRSSTSWKTAVNPLKVLPLLQGPWWYAARTNNLVKT